MLLDEALEGSDLTVPHVTAEEDALAFDGRLDALRVDLFDRVEQDPVPF